LIFGGCVDGPEKHVKGIKKEYLKCTCCCWGGGCSNKSRFFAPVAVASALSPTTCHRCLWTDAGQENQLTKSSPTKNRMYHSACSSFISILDITLLFLDVTLFVLLVLDVTLLALDVTLLNKRASN
jgi:hypothetical protein